MDRSPIRPSLGDWAIPTLARIFLLCGALFLSLSSKLIAVELEVELIHPYVRPGLLHRLRIHAQTERVQSGQLLVSVRSGEEELFSAKWQDVSDHDLSQGLVVNWLAPETWPDKILLLHVHWLGEEQALRIERRMPDVLYLARRLNEVQQRIDDQGETDPLPWLWLEQAGEELRSSVDLRGASLVSERYQFLWAWERGWRPGPETVEWAWRDPVDRSVQPYRLYLPQEEPRGIVLILLGEGESDPRKGRWSTPDAALLSALHEAGLMGLQIFPAGDSSWQGVSLRRSGAILEAVQQRFNAHLPVYGYAEGRAAYAHLMRALRHPGSYRAIILARPRYSEPSQALPVEAHNQQSREWLAMRSNPRQRLAHLQGLPVFIADRADPWWERFFEAYTRFQEGPHPALRVSGKQLLQVEWWQELLQDSGPPELLDEYRVLAPGVYGPLEVHLLDDWWRGGSLQILNQSSQRVTLRNLACGGIAWKGGAASAPVLDGEDGQAWFIPDPSPRRKQKGVFSGPLSAYAEQPFVIIWGSGEHAAAQRQNRELLQRFLADWAMHAQGRPVVLQDRSFVAQEWSDHHWILIGGPRSNGVTASLMAMDPQEWPLSWDHRAVHIQGQSFLRSRGIGVALARPHPQRPAQGLIILDGQPLWPPGTLPLQGLGDFAWQVGEQAVRTLVFDSNWQP